MLGCLSPGPRKGQSCSHASCTDLPDLGRYPSQASEPQSAPIRAGRWATRPGRASVSRLCRHCRGRYRCQHSVRLNAPGLDAACLPASLYPVIVALMTADYESRLPIRDGTADACIARNDSTVLCLLFRLSKRMHASRSRRMQQLMHPADC